MKAFNLIGESEVYTQFRISIHEVGRRTVVSGQVLKCQCPIVIIVKVRMPSVHM